MQASREWAPPGGKLGEILAEVRRALHTIERDTSAGRGETQPRAGFSQALRGEAVAVIGEIKRKSPSRGVLAADLDPVGQARAYELGGAAAISVLTEPRFFGGSGSDLVRVHEAVAIPVLRKDFHVDASQLELARRQGASAVLLIARALSPDELPVMMRQASEQGLETLVEVRSEWELERALDAGAGVVGVNSRDLETLAVDESVPARLIPRIPRDVIAVWESGISGADDVRRAADAGADAVLVGSALSMAVAPGDLMRSLVGVGRQARDG